MQILIVEDDLDVLQCLRSYLTERGHEVMTACTAEEAIAWLNCSDPALIMADLTLPKGNGRQVIQEVVKRHLHARVVVITADDDLELRRDLLSLGIITDYLFKPITIRELNALFDPYASKLT